MSDHILLSPEAHAELRVRPDRGVAYGDGVMSTMVMPDEFRRAQAYYPILFRHTPERDGFAAVALFGFENGENLFLEGDRWDARYLPLSIDVQPFLIGGSADPTTPKQVVIDMASARVSHDEGVRLFDAHARPTPYLEAIVEKLGALDVSYQASADFFDALSRHALLEPFALDVTLDDGSTNRLVGYHAIDEDRLQALDAAALGDLHGEGHLMPIFMAVASLGRLTALIERKNRRMAVG